MASQGLFDALAGAGGADIDRPKLNSFIANSQAINGLRSAQTEEALLKAQEQTEQAGARGKLEDAMLNLFPGEPSKAHGAAMLLLGHFGDAKTVMSGLNEIQQNQFHTILGDPNQLGTPAQTAAMQGATGKLAPLETVPNNYATAPGAPQPNGQQSLQGAAQTALTNAQASNPQLFHPGGANNAALFTQFPNMAKAVAEQRLDPTRVNSRNAPLFEQMEKANPGQNYNRMHADASLQSNATFQQRNMSADMLPGVLSHMTALGKKLNDGAGYSDLKAVGQMQQWLNGETNDPAYTEYMSVRNDAMLRLANVMRGVGMSDKATEMENETAKPTLAPYALDAWLKGQMSVVTPLLERQNRIVHLGEKGMGTAPLGGSSSSPAGPAPLGATAPSMGGAPAAPANGLPPGLTLAN